MTINQQNLIIKQLICIVFLGLISLTQLGFCGTTHNVYGKLFNSDGSIPDDEEITFVAYITARTDETQTQDSPGAGYEDGYWFVNVGNFLSPWTAGEVIHVDFTNTANGETSGENGLEYTLTNDVDEAPDFYLTPNGNAEIIISPSPIEFGNVTVNVASDLTVSIGNTGENNLEVTNITSDLDTILETSETSFTVAKDAPTHEITLTLTASTSGQIEGVLTITSNDPNSPKLVHITANAVEPSSLSPVVSSPQTTGEEFTVDIQAQEVTDLFGVSFELTYNTIYLDATEVTYEENLLGDDLETIDNIDDSSGIVGIGVTRKKGTAGVDGTGILVHVTFISETQDESTVSFNIQDIEAIDSNKDSITMTGVEKSIDIVPPPEVNTIVPDNGWTEDGTEVTITGANFGDSQGSSGKVTFGGTEATDYTSWSDTEIICETPAHTAGSVDVVVTTDNSFSGTEPSGFFYTPIKDILPEKGSKLGGTEVTVTGVNFGDSQGSSGKVTFGGTEAADYTSWSDTEIICETPAHATGSVDVVVTKDNGFSGTKPSGFKFLTPVYPGDTNNDGIANHNDVSPIATNWGETGPSRYDASIDWVEQLTEDWTKEGSTYVDSNGDGEVDQADLLAVGANWELTTPYYQLQKEPKVLVTSGNSDLPVMKIVSPSKVGQGENFTVRLQLEEREMSIENLFGVAFRLQWSRPDIVKATDVVTDSLLGDDLASLQRIEKGRVSVGVSKKRGQEPVRGSITVAEIDFKINPEAELGEKVRFSFSNLRANNPKNHEIKVSAESAELTLLSSVAVPVRVALSEYKDNQAPITFKLCQNGEVIQTTTTTLTFTDDGHGNAVSDTNTVKFLAQEGTYDLAVKQWHRLQKVIRDVKIPVKDGQNIDVKLNQVGDANNDNYINFDDFSLFAKFYGSIYNRSATYFPKEESIDTNWNCDFNADSLVNFDDFALLVSSYGIHGQETGVASSPPFVYHQDDGSNQDISIELIPSEKYVDIGKEIEFSLYAKNTSELYSFAVEISYSKAGLELIGSPAKGQLMKGNTLFSPKRKDSDSSKLSIIGSLTGESEGISRNGDLATLRFRVKSENPGTISLKNAFICDSNREKNTLASREIMLRAIPSSSALMMNYPNPFNPETWIPYKIAQDADVTVKVYNIAGQLIRSIELGHKNKGYYTRKDKAAYWDGCNEFGEVVGSGVYFYTLKAGDFVYTRKMVLTK